MCVCGVVGVAAGRTLGGAGAPLRGGHGSGEEEAPTGTETQRGAIMRLVWEVWIRRLLWK